MPSSDEHLYEVELKSVTKRFGSLTAVDDVSLAVESGEFFSLLGPSGCGKSTLLRLIAGFESADHGEIRIGGRKVNLDTPQKRPTAMVFQNYALFPTMTVGENVGYGLKVSGVGKKTVLEKVGQALDRVDLGGLDQKPVTQLSGGQQQRVALARAIVVEPSVLLFDEPLSNLDVALREQTRRELKRLQKELGITSIYVTHDQQEALALSDRLAVLNAGQVQQTGTPADVYFRPQNPFVAQFLGGSNVFANRNQIAILTGKHPKESHLLAIRPEHWNVHTEVDPGITFRIVEKQFLGAYVEYNVLWGETEIRIWLPPDIEVSDSFTALPTTYHWIKSP